MAASRDSAPLSLDSFRTWRVAMTCTSTPPHAINTSTHQHNCRHYFRVLLGISSISAYITRLLCCVQPKVKTPHCTPCGSTLKGHRHLAPFARRQATAHHRDSTVVANPLVSPWWQCLGSGTTLSSLTEKLLLDCEARVSWGVLRAKAAWITPFDAFVHILLRRRESSRTTALLLNRVKAALPTSRKAWAGGILCRVHRSLSTQGLNF